MKKIIFAAALLSGCSTTGPWVNRISYDMSGALQVEKCFLKTSFIGLQTYMKDCKTDVVQIREPAAAEKK